MTPQQKIKHLIIIHGIPEGTFVDHFRKGEDVDDAYSALVDRDEHWDAMSEVREGTVETGLPCEWSRHYEAKSVAAQYLDGSWVGWTYWYGGGKHSDPDSIDWMDSAYDLEVNEEEKVVAVRTFAKVVA